MILTVLHWYSCSKYTKNYHGHDAYRTASNGIHYKVKYPVQYSSMWTPLVAWWKSKKSIFHLPVRKSEKHGNETGNLFFAFLLDDITSRKKIPIINLQQLWNCISNIKVISLHKEKNLGCLHSTFRTFDCFQVFTQV